MRLPILVVGVLTAGAIFALNTTSPIAQAASGVCLKVRDLGNLKSVDDSTLMATSRNQGNFVVKMRGPCREFKQMGNYYSLRVLSNQECFDGDDVLHFRYGGACFVQSVTPAPH
jgi:hypothetical protein